MTLKSKLPNIMAASLIWGGLSAFTPLPAQISLNDLFSEPEDEQTTPTVTIEAPSPETLQELTQGNAEAFLGAQQISLARGDADKVLRDTELLLAWFDPQSLNYEKTLWYRARAYEQLGEREKLLNVTRLYLRSFGEGEYMPWFLKTLAMELVAREEVAPASDAFLAILEREIDLNAGEALAAAETFCRTGRPEAARIALSRTFDSDSPVQQLAAFEPIRDAWLLESLLLLDDKEVELPKARSHETHQDLAFNIKRALMLDLRGERVAAQESWEAIAAKSELLTEEEQALVDQRLAASSRQLWPPETPQLTTETASP